MKAILAAILALAVAWPAGTQPPGQVIRVTGLADSPPIIWRVKNDPGRVTGLSVELLERAFQDLGIRVEGVYAGPWVRAQASVRAGRVDMMAGIYFTEERRAFMDYITPPYMTNPTVVFVRKGDAFRFERWEDLVGMKGGALLGYSFGAKFDTFARASLDIELVPSIDQAFGKLLAGRNRYLIYGLYPGLAAAETGGLQDRIDVLPNPVMSEGLYFAISRKSPFDTPQICAHLAKMAREFTSQKLPERLMEKYRKLWKEQSAPSRR